MSQAINKVLGAIALTDVSGSLSRISYKILRAGDVCLVASNSAFYVYKCFESNITPDEPPYDIDNPPYIIKPEDATEDSPIRWHLISPIFFNENIKIDKAKLLKTLRIRGDNELIFENGDGTIVAKINEKSAFWVKEFETDSTKLVKNLNAEFIGGLHSSNLMTRDGTRSFFKPVSGQEPTEPDHLATKYYIDEKTKIMDSFVKSDGSIPFINPIRGVTPIEKDDLATKRYVDNEVSRLQEDISSTQSYLIYKTGKRSIPQNTSTLTIEFGGILKDYTVFITLVNNIDNEPFSTTATVTKQTSTSFTVSFGGLIDNTNYQVNWVIIGVPLELTFDDEE